MDTTLNTKPELSITAQLQTAVAEPTLEEHPLHNFLGSDEDMRKVIQTLSDLVQQLRDRVSALENPNIIP